MRSRNRGARLANRDDAVYFQSSFHLPLAARPIDIDPLNAGRAPQSEMQPEIALRQVAAAAPHFIHLGAAAGREAHARSNGAPVGPDSFKFEKDPVPRGLMRRLQQRWRLILIVDQHLNGSVVIVVSKSCAARGMALKNSWARVL